jgi:hypothetical protein
MLGATTLNKMTVFEFTGSIETILEEEVKKLLPGYWNEDTLTRNFLIAFTSRLSSVKLEDARGEFKVIANAFKQSGTVETATGDIAIVLNIQYPDGESIEGVGFLEAKKRTEDSVKFDAVRKDQLKRINKNAPRARLLLYDYEPITQFIPVYFEHRWYYDRWRDLRLMPTTHALAIPLNLTIAVDHFDTKLYKFGIPFSHQLTMRYFYGHDLEYDKKILDASKGYADKKKLSKYILTITIGPYDKTNDQVVNVNRNALEPLRKE